MDKLAPADSALVIQWLFGAAIVIVYAMDRFKIPSPMRSTTTFWRYWSAWTGYLVAMLALYVFLGGGFTAVDSSVMVPLMQGGLESASKAADTTRLPAPLLSALILTSLLPHFPVLGKVDAAVKEWFQRVGNMPFEVRELSTRLNEARYAPDEEVSRLLAPTFEELHVDPRWLLAPVGSLKQQWSSCAALYGQIRRWESARGYSRFVHEHKVSLVEIKNRIAALAELLDETTLTELDRAGDSRLIAHMRKNIRRDIAAVRQAMCDFVSAGVLNNGWNHHQRHTALTQLGFEGLAASKEPLTAHDIVLVTGLVFLALLFVPLMMRRFVDPEPLDFKLRILIMVPIIYAVSIVAAIYPKSVFSFASRPPDGQRPVAAYALSGAVAALTAFAIALLFRFAFDSRGNVLQALSTPGAFVAAWQTTIERWPWLLMTFFMTVAIAWAGDDRPSGSPRSPYVLRCTETACLAAIFGVLNWVVVELLMINGSAQRIGELQDAMPRMIATAFVAGACIGWFVPHLFRMQGRGAPKGVCNAAASVSPARG